jgi:hypothetical protein
LERGGALDVQWGEGLGIMRIPAAGQLISGEPEPEIHLTGIWATAEQQQKILEAIQTSEKFLDLAKDLSPQLAGDARREARTRLLKVVHEAGLESGLPDFDGFYGIDAFGQFVRG